jgi:hypothetical protein
MDNVRIYSAATVDNADQFDAVFTMIRDKDGSVLTFVTSTIAEARRLSNDYARAADDAEQKLEQVKTQTLDL